jgi:hypothetical protein
MMWRGAHAEHRQMIEAVAARPVKQLVEPPILLFVWQRWQGCQAELLCAVTAIADATHSKLLGCYYDLPALPFRSMASRIDHG